MRLADYFDILRRRAWIILLVSVITAASAWGFSKLQTPVYKASVQVRIIPARADLGLTQSAKWLLRSYVAVIHSETFAGYVIDELDLDMIPGGLKSNVTVADDESRFLIQIDVKDYSPAQAATIANAWAQQVIDWRNEENQLQLKENQVHADMIDPATAGLFSPKTKINVIAGAILGLLLSGVIIFFLEWVESGVLHSANDVERQLGLTVLGAIPPTE